MIFIDTGAFISKYILKDQYHEESIIKWEKIFKRKLKLFTSNHIIDETITLLSRKTTQDFALEKGKILYNTEIISILRTNLEDELIALQIFEKYKDQKISFTDCLTVSLMKRYNITKIYTFDIHFKIFKFENI